MKTLAKILLGSSLALGIVSIAEANQITSNKAISIAKKRVGGGQVTDIDRYSSSYEVDIERGCTQYEVRVDARSGKVLSVRSEHDCD